METASNLETIFRLLCWLVLCPPLLSLAWTGASAVLNVPIRERATNRAALWSVAVSLSGSLLMLGFMIATGRQSIPVELGQWVALPEQHFHFTFKFIIDRLSIVFLILSLSLCGVVASFARVYLHRDPGFRRFYLFFAVFELGMTVSSIAGTIETLFAGWELAGLSSAMLVAFFQDRPAPVLHGLRIWIVYRIADAAFLAGVIVLHHAAGSGDLERITGAGVWPEGTAVIAEPEAFAAGLLLVIAAAGKSALLPFSGWLPRAMEGPTPSSAIFYGALSVHLGAYLLLRMAPLLESSRVLAAIIVVLGLATAIYAWIAAKVQSDVKSALAFASLTQVGLIVAEIGIGLRFVPLAHIIGNACLRTLQLLRAPSLIHDRHQFENSLAAISDNPGKDPRPNPWIRLPDSWRWRIYRIGYHRDFFDLKVYNGIVEPFLIFLRRCDALEARWIRFLSGPAKKDPGIGAAGADVETTKTK